MHHEADLPRAATAPALARRALVEWYGDLIEDDELDQARLVVSELVTNAVLHGRGRIRLSTSLDEDRLLVEVIDEGSGLEHKVAEVPPEEFHGRGLAIVDNASSRWGVHEGTTHVWAEFERPGPRIGAHKKPEA